VYNSTLGAWSRTTSLVGNISFNSVSTGGGVFWANGAVYGPAYTVGNTPPTRAKPGDQWYFASIDTLYEYVFDGVNSNWVDISGQSLNIYSSGNLTVAGNIVPNANVTYSIGTPTARFSSLYLSGNTIDLGGAVMKTDAATGAIAFIPVATTANPNPTGIVVAPTGSITTVTTTGGNLTANSISNASNSIVGTGSVVGNLVASGNAVIQAINLAGNNNLLTYSQNFSTNGSGWQVPASVTVTIGNIAPNGTSTANFCNVTSTSNYIASIGITVIPATTYTFSFYALAGTTTTPYYAVYNVSGSSYIVTSTNYYSQINSSTWTRITTTFTVPSGCTQIYVYMLNQGSSLGTISLWGAQLELGTTASPYTPTTTSIVTTYNNINIPYGNLVVSGSTTLANTTVSINNSSVVQSGSHLTLANPTGGQTSIGFTFGGTPYGEVRVDNGGNFLLNASSGSFYFDNDLATGIPINFRGPGGIIFQTVTNGTNNVNLPGNLAVVGNANVQSITGNTLNITGNTTHSGATNYFGGNVGVNITTPSANLHIKSSNWDNTLGSGVIIENTGNIGAGVTFRPDASAVTNGTYGWSMYAGATGASIGDGAFGFWNHAMSANGSTYPYAFFLDKNGYMTVKNQPACLIACQASDITWTTNGIINYGGNGSYPATKIFDTTNSFNMTTSTYTAPVAGIYYIGCTANGRAGGTGSDSVPRAYVRINGSSVGNGLHLRGNSTLYSGGDLDQRTFAAVYKLNAGDYIDVYVFDAAFDTFGANYFCAYKLG
jgi:hypothetical protein